MGVHSASLTRELLWEWTDTKGTIPALPGADISTLPSSPRRKQDLQFLHPEIQLVAKETLLWCILCCPQRKVKRNNDSYSLRCAWGL